MRGNRRLGNLWYDLSPSSSPAEAGDLYRVVACIQATLTDGLRGLGILVKFLLRCF